MISLATGAASGMLRGMAAAATYAALLGVEITVADLIEGHVLHTAAPSGLDDVVTGFVLFTLFILLIAGMVGAGAGFVLGAALVPLVNRWRRPRRELGWTVAAVFTLAGIVIFPTIPLGWGQVSDVESALTLKLLPAALGGSAAAWHVVSLHRLLTGAGVGVGVSSSKVPAGGGRARPRGAASDA